MPWTPLGRRVQGPPELHNWAPPKGVGGQSVMYIFIILDTWPVPPGLYIYILGARTHIECQFESLNGPLAQRPLKRVNTGQYGQLRPPPLGELRRPGDGVSPWDDSPEIFEDIDDDDSKLRMRVNF